MRAVSVDSDAAQLMGINVNRTISFTLLWDQPWQVLVVS